MHPNDTLYALEWAVRKANEEAKHSDEVKLTILPALLHERDKAQKEAGRG